MSGPKEGWVGPFEDDGGDKYYYNRETGESEWAEDVDGSADRVPPRGTPTTLRAFRNMDSREAHQRIVKEHGVSQNESLGKLHDALKDVFAEQTTEYIGEISTLQDQLVGTEEALQQKQVDYDKLFHNVEKFQVQQDEVEARCRQYEQQIQELQSGLQQTVALLEASDQGSEALKDKLGAIETSLPTAEEVSHRSREHEMMAAEDERSAKAATFESNMVRGAVRSFEYGNKQIFSAMSEFQIDVVNPPGSQRVNYMPDLLLWPLGGDRFTRISAGANHVVAITERGAVFEWGYILGYSSMFPAQVQNIPIAEKVSCGLYHTALVTLEGALYTWGAGSFGQLGHGEDSDRKEPKQVQALNRLRVVDVACGFYHTASVEFNGNLHTWGLGCYAQLGLGDFENQSVRAVLTLILILTLTLIWTDR